MLKKVFPAGVLVAAFLYFAARDRQVQQPAKTPEDVLITMVQAMGSGDIAELLHCFGGELAEQLDSIVRQRGTNEVARLLKERNQRVKGFAILNQEPQGPDRLLVSTETVYAHQNTRQSFLLASEKGSWKIIRSDSEMVSDWDNNFGKSIGP